MEKAMCWTATEPEKQQLLREQPPCPQAARHGVTHPGVVSPIHECCRGYE